MSWTYAKPTKPGFYWYFEDDAGNYAKPEILHIREPGQFESGLQADFHEQSPASSQRALGTYCPICLLDGHFWSEPIELPQSPESSWQLECRRTLNETLLKLPLKFHGADPKKD